jgi:hypothetical protein
MQLSEACCEGVRDPCSQDVKAALSMLASIEAHPSLIITAAAAAAAAAAAIDATAARRLGTSRAATAAGGVADCVRKCCTI